MTRLVVEVAVNTAGKISDMFATSSRATQPVGFLCCDFGESR